MRYRYIVNKETVGLFEELDQYGNCYTRIIEGRNTFIVEWPLKKNFEDTLRFYCTTLEGAIHGAKFIIGEKYHPPIPINAAEGLIMLPCGSIRRKTSMWIANNQIIELEQIGKETIIFTNYGHKIIVPIKLTQIEMKMGQASRIQTTQIYRLKQDMSFYYHREMGLMLRMKVGERNMSVEEMGDNQ